MTAYTIGNEHGYDETLASGTAVYKLGKRPEEDYPGGWVCKTIDDAQNFINDQDLPFKAAVYEIELPGTWETDVTSKPGGDGVHNLLVNAKIIKKVSNG